MNPGDVFTSLDNVEYIVFKQLETVTSVLRKEALDKTMRFGDNNDWRESDIRKYLNNEYLGELEESFGAENIIPHSVDLFSHDGLRDYGISMDKVSLLTYDMYRNNRKIIGDNLDSPWWLSTPDSTPSGYGASGVQYVYSDGDVCFGNADWNVKAVRPFCILNSNIFVSIAK